MEAFGLPKSAEKILLVLSSSNNGYTQEKIRQKTGLSIRTVKGTLQLLKKKNLLKESVIFGDMRCKVYRLRGEMK